MNPLWAKAPLNLVLRFRKIGAALLAAAMLLGLVSVAGPLFLESSGSAALAQELSQTFPYNAGLGLSQFGPLNGDDIEDSLANKQKVFDRIADELGHLGAPTSTLIGPERPVFVDDAQSEIRLITRTDAPAHVNVSVGDASGTLLARSIAEEVGGVEPGDEILVGRDRTPVTVSGIYEDLATASQVDPFWFTIGGLIFTDQTGLTPPPFLIMPRDEFMDLAQVQEVNGQYWFEYPLVDSEMTFEEATALAVYFDKLDLAVNESKSSDEKRVSDLTDALGQGVFRSTLPPLVRRTDRTIAALEGPVLVLSLAGAVVALAVMGAAGSYLIAARRTESILLSARGMSPWLQGVRALSEAAIPTVIGAAVGFALGALLVVRFGPSDLLPPDAYTEAGLQTSVALLLGAGALAIAAALAAKGLVAEVGRKQRSWGRFWWEVPIAALAGAAYFAIATRDSVIISSARGDRIDVFVLLFPILFLTAMAGLLGRGLRFVFGKLRGIGHSWPPPMYLATRRLASAPGSVLGLLVAAILSIGILVYAQSLASTIQTSTEAKAGVFVGAETSLKVYSSAEVPADYPYPATRTRTIRGLSSTDRIEFDMLGVDRATFASAAFWDDSFASRSLSDLLDAIEPRAGQPLPAIVAGRSLGDPIGIDITTEATVDPVASARAFPGMQGDTPLVIVDLEQMGTLFSGSSSALTAGAEDEIWVDGPYQQSIQAAQGELEVGTTNGMQQVLALPSLKSLTWTFSLLKILGIASGLVALAALLLYAQTRQRSTVVSYALARRMGLSQLAHSFALVVELAVLIASSVVAGTLLAEAVARLLYGKMDLLPNIPPEPILDIPVIPILLVALAGVLATIFGAIAVQRSADRAKVAEVLRLAD